MKIRNTSQGSLCAPTKLGLGLAVMAMASAAGAQVSIADSPLFVNAAVTPSILIAVDDSTSMDSETLMRTNDGALWWHTGDRSFAGRNQLDAVEPGRLNYNRAGNASAVWRKYIYLFPNGTGLAAGRKAENDADNDHFAVPPLPQYAFARSPDYNFSYFNPSTTYNPWPSLGTGAYLPFGNSNPLAARTDPAVGSVTVNLTTEIENNAANNVFRLFQGMTVPAGIRNAPQGGAWSTNQYTPANNNDDNNNRRAISYFPAQFYLQTGTALPACYGYLPSAVTTNGRGPDGTTVLNGYEIRPANFEAACGQTAAQNYQAAIQNFANWFTYYRKRHLAARNALGAGFESIDNFRVGLYSINDIPGTATSLPIRDLLIATDRNAFFNQAYTDIGTGGTPNRAAVNAMRAQLARTDANAPIRLACQKNFGVLITDGFANVDTSSGVGNADGSMGSPFADSHSNTMADIAASLYLTNPRPTLLPLGQVPVPRECGTPGESLRLDCNPNLHLNLFAISLGAPGNIYGVDMAATNDPFANPPAWPNPDQTRNPQQIDDLWHATLNSRGEFLSVEVPSDLGDSFRRVLDSIRNRVESSGSSAATSSAVLQTDTLLYNASFRSDDWSGTLEAKQINGDGSVGEVEWSAEALLAARTPGSRDIFTRTEAGAAVEFEFANLGAAQQAALNVNPTGAPATTATGADRVAWLRGVEHAQLRSRLNGTDVRRIGDLIGSDPQFMAKPDYGYSLFADAQGLAYQNFRTSTAYTNRPNALFVGSNGGMFHAFDAASGEELFAYVPSEVLLPGDTGTHAQINELMVPDYTHRYFVDGSAVLSDAYVGGAWRTVVVGTMGAGGRTVFALDVSDPANFEASDVMWEFKYSAAACVADPTGAAGSTACNAVGEGISKPKIVRLASGRWAAVFGNGFNSAGNAARLLVVDLQTGRLLYNLEATDASNPASANTAASPNGLSPVETTDWPSNQLTLTNAYAGDIKGNLWRFNFGASPPVVTRLFTAVDGSGARQPITARPRLALKPGSNSDIVVLFGTGSFFRVGDDNTTSPQVQTMYGVFDSPTTATTVATRAELLAQTLTENTTTTTIGTETYAAGTLRFVSENELAASNRGWRIDLVVGSDPAEGERVISEATFPSGATQERVRFTTLIPDDDPCGPGRRGFVMDVDLLGGGRFDGAVFDLSGDGAFNNGDAAGGNQASGIGGTTGERLTIIRDQDSNLDNLYGGDGSQVARGANTSGPVGRQSWRQLR